MDCQAWRVARRFFSAKAMARSLPEYIQLVAEDGVKAEKWKKAFLANSLRDVKAAHAKVISDLNAAAHGAKTAMKGLPVPGWVEFQKKDADAILAKFTSAVHEINQKFTRENALALHGAYSDEHFEYWDPEMFADGQTKADYPRQIMDSLFEACDKAYSTYSEFWRRFDAKWDFGSMNVTLLSFLPQAMRDESHINMEWLKEIHGVGLVVAMTNYQHRLTQLLAKINQVPTGGSAHAVGVGLSALMNEAKANGDTWTADFAKSLMDQLHRRRPFSDKQKAIVDKKLHDYGIPPVNYAVAW